MDAVAVLALCAVVIAVAFVVVAVFLVRFLLQVRRTAARAEAVLRRAEPLLDEVERAVREYRELGRHLAETADKADRLMAQIEGVGSKALGATDMVLSGVGMPLGRALAVWAGLKTGLRVFLRLSGRGRRRGARA